MPSRNNDGIESACVLLGNVILNGKEDADDMESRDVEGETGSECVDDLDEDMVRCDDDDAAVKSGESKYGWTMK